MSGSVSWIRIERPPNPLDRTLMLTSLMSDHTQIVHRSRM
jgi:hypothetical protein